MTFSKSLRVEVSPRGYVRASAMVRGEHRHVLVQLRDDQKEALRNDPQGWDAALRELRRVALAGLRDGRRKT